MKLWGATTNPGKLVEFQLAGVDFEPLPNLAGIAPSPEDGTTFEANAIQKALYYSHLTHGAVFADDSGLQVKALDGAPGIRSARDWNNALVLERLAEVHDRRARFVCVIAVAREGDLMTTFRGEVEGEILQHPQGTGGFGYDPIFFYPPLGRSFAELSDQQKFEVSHRGRALRAMMSWLNGDAVEPVIFPGFTQL